MTTALQSDKKHIWMPDYLQREMGQFNVFPISSTPADRVNCQPYNRKGFYKISLLNGGTRLFYADKTLEFPESALLFSNPYIPYSWEHIGEDRQTGFYCIFTEAFFNERQHVKDYPVFKPGSNCLFELSSTQIADITLTFERMLSEIDTDFAYKYDVLRNLTLDLVYKALKMQPTESRPAESNGPLRIASLFTELLERQFPIESPQQRIRLRFPAEYAEHLSVHINHLNRSLKKVTGKTTSELIAARVMQEARILLQHTDWNISEVGWCLGFEELPHFINFFKKNESHTPRHFRSLH
jgi:AraC-like DNA-binding protein